MKSEKYSTVSHDVAVSETTPGDNSTSQYVQVEDELVHNGYYPIFNHLGPGAVLDTSIPAVTHCSPSIVHSEGLMHKYQCSPEMAPLSPGIHSFLPNNTSPPSPSNKKNLYTADPASPMQTYSHDMGKDGYLPEGANSMEIRHSPSIPSHPPPNYTEATAMARQSVYVHLPPNYMEENEYPHMIATLPDTKSS